MQVNSKHLCLIKNMSETLLTELKNTSLNKTLVRSTRAVRRGLKRKKNMLF